MIRIYKLSKLIIKKVDKLAFLHNGTGVPMGVRSFFDKSLGGNENKIIKLLHKRDDYLVKFGMDN